MKKKQIVVVKKIERPSPKKGFLVSRKVNGENGFDLDVEKSFVGNSSPQVYLLILNKIWMSYFQILQHPLRNDETWISRSILGQPNNFDLYFEESHSEENAAEPSKPKPLSRVTTTESLASSGHNSASRKKVTQKQVCPREPLDDPDMYLQALAALKIKASKLRARELEKEENLVQYLPVNERFDLNKEGKVLAMWQERQKKWDNIQRQLANRVGGSTDTLMMNTGDEFRAKNEEYDVLQAAVPVEQRFGADSWQMQLRGGTERSVSVGHVFSGLSCEVTIKRVNPAIIRKPRKATDANTLVKKTAFIDPTPSLLLRQKQLRKTLTTLRPHTLGPSEVEGLIIESKNLFDWAIDSTEKYFCDLAAEKSTSMVVGQSFEQNDTDAQHESVKSTGKEEQRHPQLAFLSHRNLLFSGIQGETVHRTISFRNIGATAISYYWKKNVSDKDMNESSVSVVMASRNSVPRGHLLSKQRDSFFCHSPTGQILPGEYVETIFSFCSKGVGGTFDETWMLETTPKAAVRYGKDPQMENQKLDSQQNMHIPSVVYVALRGQTITIDEYQHRRSAIRDIIEADCKQALMTDQTYLALRRVRPPVTSSELEERKISLFKTINASTLQNLSPVLASSANVQLTINRFHHFVHIHQKIKSFAKKLDIEYAEKCGSVDMGYNDISLVDLLRGVHTDRIVPAIREGLFPEKNIVSC